jgi:hypothetical protein
MLEQRHYVGEPSGSMERRANLVEAIGVRISASVLHRAMSDGRRLKLSNQVGHRLTLDDRFLDEKRQAFGLTMRSCA